MSCVIEKKSLVIPPISENQETSSINSVDEKIQELSIPTFKGLGDLMNYVPVVEHRYNQQIGSIIEEANQIQRTAKQLISLTHALNQHLTNNKSNTKDSTLPTEILDLCKELETKGFTLLNPAETKASLDRINDLKGRVSDEIKLLESNLQSKFSTEISPKVNDLQTILECFKGIARHLERLMSTISSNQAKG